MPAISKDQTICLVFKTFNFGKDIMGNNECSHAIKTIHDRQKKLEEDYTRFKEQQATITKVINRMGQQINSHEKSLRLLSKQLTKNDEYFKAIIEGQKESRLLKEADKNEIVRAMKRMGKDRGCAAKRDELIASMDQVVVAVKY